MADNLLETPPNLFQQIEAAIIKNPKRLSTFHWHELPNGKEAYDPEDIRGRRTLHDLAGWIVALTPNGPRFERLREDVNEYANDILRSNGREPLPWGIHFADEESQWKVIRKRAAEERKVGQ